MTLQGNDGTGFPVANVANRLVNSSTIVLAPGTYSTFDIEYTVTHPISHIQGTVTKHYTNVTFNPGKNKKLEFDLPYPVTPGRYLFEDGTTGTIEERGSHTIIGVVVREKTATEDGMAMYLNRSPDYHLSFQGARGSSTYTAQQWNNVMYPNFTDAARDMEGYKYTWEGAGSWNGTTVKATSASPLFNAFQDVASTPSSAITFANGKRGKWFLPSLGQMMLAYQALCNIEVLPTTPGQSSSVGDYARMKQIFVLAGAYGTGFGNYYPAFIGYPDDDMWTSTQADASHAYSVAANYNEIAGTISFSVQKSILASGVGVARPFIYF